MKDVKKFIVDTITNLLFWHPLFAFFEFFILGLTMQEVILARTGNFFFAVVMGGVFGRAIDLGRYLLNRPYYDETIKHIPRKVTSWRTELRDAAVDVLTTSIYWGIIMGLWFYLVVGLDGRTIWLLIGTYTILQIILAGFYGKVLNWSRRRFGV